MHLEEHVSLVKFEPAGSIELHLLPGAPKELANELREKLNAWTGKRWMVALSKRPASCRSARSTRERKAAEIAEIKKHPAVAAVLKQFPDAEITSVQPLPGLTKTERYSARGMTLSLRSRHERPDENDEAGPGDTGPHAEAAGGSGALEVEGQSGAGLVKVKLNGKMEARSIKIDPSLIKPDEAEILEDLILAAFQDAKSKAETAVQAKMQEITGGLQLPPGLKLF